VVTEDPGIVTGLTRLFEADCRSSDAGLPHGLSESLIVGPDQARTRFLEMLSQARHTIRIIDHRVTDPEVVAQLRNCQAAGMRVEVLGAGAVGGLQSHGKMLLVDDRVAAIGSISLSRPSLNLRREVAVMVHDPGNLATLKRFFEEHGCSGNSALPAEWRYTEQPDDDDALDELE